ncbi:MAG: dihydroorotate dehydrogenase [bacterium]|nr:dihydroorotate dehydrogenase [bacterium]
MAQPIHFFGKRISGMFTLPSGIIGTEVSVIERIAREIPEIGILTTKSIGLEPRKGNKEPILARYAPGSFTNAVGLTNPGVDEFVKRLRTIHIPDDKFLLVSIFGGSEEEFEEVAKRVLEFADGFELNMSCPHSNTFGQVIGADTELLECITRRVSALGKPTLVKISPNLDCEAAVLSALRGGASGIVAVNTKGPETVCHDGFPVLSNKVGGMSGAALLESGVAYVQAIRKITDMPIIACGGISSAADVRQYASAGASFFGIGSALAGLETKEIKTFFHTLSDDLSHDSNNASHLLKEVNMDYQAYHVKERIQMADDLCELVFEEDIRALPGQFIFAWLPEIGEKPFSVFDDAPMSLLIQKFGAVTDALSKLNTGDIVYIRGPYGNSPTVTGKTLLVGGGTGIASLYLFAKNTPDTIAVLGAKDGNHLPYKKFESVCKKVHLATDSGDIGEKGFVTSNLKQILADENPTTCLNCGPKVMIDAASALEKDVLPIERILSSIDFLTKCGVGICGSCATSKGLRSCVDGTFLDSHQI